MDRPYIEENTRQLERMRALVRGLDGDQLTLPVNDYWTIAGVLGHIGFWDARVIALADKLERVGAFTPDDDEPEDVDWINDSTRPFIHAVEPRSAAELALRLAEDADRRVAVLPEDKMWPVDPASPINAFRSIHRGEHLDEIEAALRS
jgi:hypothetical protein